MDTEVRRTVRKIFKNLRKKQPKMGSARKSDRVNVDAMLREYSELDTFIRSKD